MSGPRDSWRTFRFEVNDDRGDRPLGGPPRSFGPSRLDQVCPTSSGVDIVTPFASRATACRIRSARSPSYLRASR